RFCRRLALASLVMNPGHDPERDGGIHGMPELLGQAQPVAAVGESLVGITQQPTVYRQVPTAAGTRIVAAIEKRLRSVLVAIIKSDADFGVPDALRRPPHVAGCRPQRMMRLEQSTRVVAALRNAQESLPVLVGLLILPAIHGD